LGLFVGGKGAGRSGVEVGDRDTACHAGASFGLVRVASPGIHGDLVSELGQLSGQGTGVQAHRTGRFATVCGQGVGVFGDQSDLHWDDSLDTLVSGVLVGTAGGLRSGGGIRPTVDGRMVLVGTDVRGGARKGGAHSGGGRCRVARPCSCTCTTRVRARLGGTRRSGRTEGEGGDGTGGRGGAPWAHAARAGRGTTPEAPGRTGARQATGAARGAGSCVSAS